MHDLSINVCILLTSKSRLFQTYLGLLAATLPDCSAFLFPPFLALHAFYFPFLLFGPRPPPTLLFFLFFTAKPLPSSSQKLVECHHVSPVQHSPTFCLCVSYPSAHWAIAAVIHLFISHADLLSRIALCKINIVPSTCQFFTLSPAMFLHFHLSPLCFFCLLCV